MALSKGADAAGLFPWIVMDIEEIKTKVGMNEYVYSHHADLERRADELTLTQVEDVLLTGAILEQYPGLSHGITS